MSIKVVQDTGQANAEETAVERLQRNIPGSSVGPEVNQAGDILAPAAGDPIISARIAAAGGNPDAELEAYAAYESEAQASEAPTGDPRLASIAQQRTKEAQPLQESSTSLSDKAPAGPEGVAEAQDQFIQDYAEEGGVSADFAKVQEQRRADQQAAELKPYNEAIVNKQGEYQAAQTDADKEVILGQISDLEEQKALKFDDFKKKNAATQVVPLTEQGPQETQQRIRDAVRYHSQLMQSKLAAKNSADSGAALSRMRDELVGPFLSSQTAIPAEAAQKLGVEQSTPMAFLEQTTGIKHAGFLMNNVALAVSQAFLGGKLNGKDSDHKNEVESIEDILGLNMEMLDPFADDASSTWDPKKPGEERLSRLPTSGKIASVIGSILKDNLNRQGVTFDANPDVVGQVILLAALNAGTAKAYDYVNPSTGLAELKIGWKPDGISEVAALGVNVFPVKYKKAAVSPRSEENYKYALTKAKKGVGTDISVDAVEAAMHMEQIPRAPKIAELAVADGLVQLADAYHALRAAGRTEEITPEMIRATELLGTGDKEGAVANAQGQTPGQQNQATSTRNVIHMKDRVGTNYFIRVKVGANESRKYLTSEESGTYYKTIRGVEAAGINARPTISPVVDAKVPRSNRELKAYVKSQLKPKGKVNVTAVHGQVGSTLSNEFKDMNFRYIVGSFLGTAKAKSDPLTALRDFETSSAEWAAKAAGVVPLLLVPNNPNATLEEMVRARASGTEVASPEVMAEKLPEILSLMDGATKDTWGYILGVMIDNYLYTAVKAHNKRNPGKPIIATLPSVVQFDLTSAGTSTMYKDGANREGLKSVRLIVEQNPDGTAISYDGPRQLYWKSTQDHLMGTFSAHYGKEDGYKIGTAISLEIDNYMLTMDDAAKDKFVDDWGKAPIMVTGYSKHEKTHQEPVIKFLNKHPVLMTAMKEVMVDHLKFNYNEQAFINDLSTLHEKALKSMFSADELAGINFIKGLGVSYHMGRKPWVVNVFGQDMMFGVETKENVGSVEVGSAVLPLTSGQSMNDQLGRGPTKDIVTFQDGKKQTGTSKFVPDYNTAIPNSVLAAMGQKRESIVLDDVLNQVQGTVKGAYSANFYDGLSADSNSALFLWYLGNYDAPVKALKSNPREALVRQGIKDINETNREILGLKEDVDLSYPNGDWAAVGWEVDNLYRRFVQRRSNKGVEVFGEDQVTQTDSTLKKVFADLQAKGWVAPEVIMDPKQPAFEQEQARGGFTRYILSSQQRNQTPLSPKALSLAYNAVLFDKGLIKGARQHGEFINWATTGTKGVNSHDALIKEVENSDTIEWFTTK